MFEKDESGNLTKDGFTNLRNLIIKSCQEEFKPVNEDFMKRRIEAFKKNDWFNYAKLINAAEQDY